MVPFPVDIPFSDEYRISAQAVHAAFRRGIVRVPNAEAAEFRRLDSERCEDMFLSLQAGIRKGDPRSIEVGVKVLAHKAEINGYKAPARVGRTAALSASRLSGGCVKRRKVGKQSTRSNGRGAPAARSSTAVSLRGDPTLFARVVLAAHLWKMQHEILRALGRHSRVAVKACTPRQELRHCGRCFAVARDISRRNCCHSCSHLAAGRKGHLGRDQKRSGLRRGLRKTQIPRAHPDRIEVRTAKLRHRCICGELLISGKISDCRVGRWRGPGFDDADVSIVLPKILYGGFSPVRLQGRLVERRLPG